MTCVVPGCKSNTSRKEYSDEIVSFHRFPMDETIKNEWIRRISRINWTPKVHSHICSKHFRLQSFEPNENIKYRRLKANAIPTLHLPDETIMIPDPLLLDISNESSSSSGTVVLKVHNNYKKPLSDSEGNNVPASKRPKPKINVETNTDSEISQQISNLQKIVTDYEKQIKTLKKKLERVTKVSKRRLRKINTLTKRTSRSNMKNSQLCDILIEKLKQENVQSEHLAL